MPEITPATQQLVEIKDIKDGVVYLKGGGLRRVLMVSGINFDLKSEAEQTLILNSFQDFLNSLDFSVQFFVHSRKVNINSYLETMEERKKEETNELLKIQIEDYIKFVRAFVEENTIITKNFFVVVPYDPIVAVQKAGGIFSVFSGKKTTGGEISNQANLEQLSRRVDQVINGLEQIGLRVAVLGDDELTELYYNLYNPQLVEKRGLEISH
jgi:type IV secretory pathway VirB4 component